MLVINSNSGAQVLLIFGRRLIQEKVETAIGEGHRWGPGVRPWTALLLGPGGFLVGAWVHIIVHNNLTSNILNILLGWVAKGVVPGRKSALVRILG